MVDGEMKIKSCGDVAISFPKASGDNDSSVMVNTEDANMDVFNIIAPKVGLLNSQLYSLPRTMGIETGFKMKPSSVWFVDWATC